ncbi:GNAT family N-acetyltransferase [Arcanobacterium buesumense]|uniref:GNAT family N-acetyltransferase n=1 Tax=Arcanobacterium buesumense TaxID=2722751 RepID=A0A6H2EI18_9ACTO|nr:GNAT family N-acetyltransferase [Arcanobacterium buesumense]QJC21208.1 GNAT family N-acetyltransferase [Arcanobacterium buesumense]
MNNHDRFYLRPAARVDAEAIYQLHTDILRETTPQNIHPHDTYDHLVELLTDPGASSIWVGECNNEIVGYVRSDALGAGRKRMLALTWLGVRSADRRRGYGTKLLTAAIGDMPAYAFTPSAQVTPFLNKNGFESIKNDDETRAIIHELHLADTAEPHCHVMTFWR